MKGLIILGLMIFVLGFSIGRAYERRSEDTLIEIRADSAQEFRKIIEKQYNL